MNQGARDANEKQRTYERRQHEATVEALLRDIAALLRELAGRRS